MRLFFYFQNLQADFAAYKEPALALCKPLAYKKHIYNQNPISCKKHICNQKNISYKKHICNQKPLSNCNINQSERGPKNHLILGFRTYDRHRRHGFHRRHGYGDFHHGIHCCDDYYFYRH
jgi:hypothetical protein